MIQLALDFRDESEALYALLEPLSEEAFAQKTQFKDWTLRDVVAHLHMWNWAADLTFNDGEAFQNFWKGLVAKIGGGQTLAEITEEWVGGVGSRDLLEKWRGFYLPMSDRFGAADPKARVVWAGPDMSVRSSITARLMETWAHGQEVYDALGVERVDMDRIKNIAVLGVNTFRWTFVNHGLEVPTDLPHVRLKAPSGAVWNWNEPSEECLVEGDAAEFCQVVTQVRNLADTKLRAVGDAAERWMSIAQCFAGPASAPPAPGSRFRQS